MDIIYEKLNDDFVINKSLINKNDEYEIFILYTNTSNNWATGSYVHHEYNMLKHQNHIILDLYNKSSHGSNIPICYNVNEEFYYLQPDVFIELFTNMISNKWSNREFINNTADFKKFEKNLKLKYINTIKNIYSIKDELDKQKLICVNNNTIYFCEIYLTITKYINDNNNVLQFIEDDINNYPKELNQKNHISVLNPKDNYNLYRLNERSYNDRKNVLHPDTNEILTIRNNQLVKTYIESNISYNFDDMNFKVENVYENYLEKPCIEYVLDDINEVINEIKIQTKDGMSC